MKKQKIPIPCDGCLCLAMCINQTELAPIARKCDEMRHYLFTNGTPYDKRVLNRKHFYEASDFLKIRWKDIDIDDEGRKWR